MLIQWNTILQQKRTNADTCKNTDELKELECNGIQIVRCLLCKILEQTKLMYGEKNIRVLYVSRDRSELSGMIEMFYIFIDVGYAFVKTHCSVPVCPFQYVNYTLKQL